MYRLEREAFLKSRFILLWALLGFQAGFINSFGFLACGRYVSHVTGFGTQIGMLVADQKWWLALELFCTPFTFMLGAFVSGLFTSVQLERGNRPRYILVMALMPAIVLILALLGYIDTFGEFGEALVSTRDFILLFSLSFVCGIQNGCFASMTKGQIRTTHLTGISTDLGTDLARFWFGKLNSHERRLVRRTNISRFATFGAFALGAILSVVYTDRHHYLALLVPFLTSIVVLVSMMRISWSLDAAARPSAA